MCVCERENERDTAASFFALFAHREYLCVCVCERDSVCACKREERSREIQPLHLARYLRIANVCVCVCMCVRERQCVSERERRREL